LDGAIESIGRDNIPDSTRLLAVCFVGAEISLNTNLAVWVCNCAGGTSLPENDGIVTIEGNRTRSLVCFCQNAGSSRRIRKDKRSSCWNSSGESDCRKWGTCTVGVHLKHVGLSRQIDIARWRIAQLNGFVVGGTLNVLADNQFVLGGCKCAEGDHG
jgi:hypothetical protein